MYVLQPGFDSGTLATAFVLCPRALPPPNVRFRGVTDHPAILFFLPFARNTFLRLIQNMRLHRALPVILDNGAPTITRVPSSFDGSKAYVYILRVEHTMSHHTALTVTHIPGKEGSKVYAVMLGCSTAEMDTAERKLASSRNSAGSPFTLIKIFLELEKKHRFNEVDAKITHFQDTVQNYERLPIGTGSLDPAGRSRNAQDPKNLIGLYLDVCHVKNSLVAWRAQIDDFREYAADFPNEADIESAEYLHRLASLYDHKINKCDLVLQGTSLTFQMETAHLARLDSQLARLDTVTSLHDGKQMKAIALLTMVFLPATFVATLMAVPVFDWNAVTTVPPWSIYLIFFVPMTVIVLLVYFAWNRWFEPKALNSSLFR
jgi:Mg2+ and Co2+ transporter CorA